MECTYGEGVEGSTCALHNPFTLRYRRERQTSCEFTGFDWITGRWQGNGSRQIHFSNWIQL